MIVRTYMLSATELRQDIYQKLDEVIAKQEPLLIDRKGHILKIVPLGRSSRIASLEPQELVVGDPDELVHTDWSKNWSPGPHC